MSVVSEAPASFINQVTLQAAFIAISSCVVGSAFRFLETMNPQYQQAKVISDPPTVQHGMGIRSDHQYPDQAVCKTERLE